ncbi:MAG: hypothetical protein C5B51_15110 [Terriglobia bacterium]|nr:MAG: hypothetical protein C5B51_15110 [Terriglobia bacterium]
MKVDVYRSLLRINAAFEEVIQGLAELRASPAFQVRELDRFAALSKETRATTNSYLTSAMETAETAEAGRRYRQRRRRERREEATP